MRPFQLKNFFFVFLHSLATVEKKTVFQLLKKIAKRKKNQNRIEFEF